MHPFTFFLLGLMSTTSTAQVSNANRIECAGAPATPPKGWSAYTFTLKHGLNYEFLRQQPKAADQICQYGGYIVNRALSITAASTWKIESLRPNEELGYTPSAMIVIAESGGLNLLNEQLRNSTALMYTHPELIVRQLAQQIDDSFNVTLSATEF